MKGIKIVVGEKNENILFKDSIDEQTAYQLVDQYMLAQFTSVIPNDFNVIFKGKPGLSTSITAFLNIATMIPSHRILHSELI